jgi:hypothetical protein
MDYHVTYLIIEKDERDKERSRHKHAEMGPGRMSIVFKFGAVSAVGA